VRFSEVLSFEVDEWVCGAEERAGRREGGLRCCVLLYVCMYVLLSTSKTQYTIRSLCFFGFFRIRLNISYV
jgi:hypothetical protein